MTFGGQQISEILNSKLILCYNLGDL